MKTMLGLWLENNQLSMRDDIPVPKTGPAEALVRVTRTGICNTDIELTRGYYPYRGILGHEFVGTVVEGPRGLQGQRVVGEINAVCGTCPACTHGRRTHCQNRTVLGIVGRDGAFAEYLTLPIENLHLVPDVVPDDVAVFTEPLAAALQIQEQIDIGAGARVLLVGDGKLGQLIARSLAVVGCDLLVIGRHERKLGRLADLGISTLTAPGAEEASARPDEQDLAGAPPHSHLGLDSEFDIAIECTGKAAGFALARDALRPRGTLVMKSTYADSLTLDVSSLVVDEITLVGSRCGPFAPALGLLERQEVMVADLIDATYALPQAVEAMHRAQQPGALKVLLGTG
jgi:threonine dehydrogenase-like Zn-dependent dehydrogenase